MSSFESSPILQKLLADFIDRVERGLQDAVRREQQVLTGEMLQSIRAGAVTQGQGWISGHVYYSDLLRIKDMKVLNYSTIPPIGPIERWVEQVGVGRFAYVPGYDNDKQPGTETEKIQRIAAGVAWHLKATPNVRRGYRGIYNDPLWLWLVPQFYEDMGAAARVWAAQQFSEAFGYETFVSPPTENVNAARIMAAWNARTTRLSRKND